jgi:two-component system sensor histidine kinase VicK
MICCTGLIALLDLMVVVFVQSHLSSVLRAEYLSKGHNMAANLAVRSGHLVLTEEFVSLLRLVKDLEGSDEDVAYAYVTDRKGHVLAHTFAGGFPQDLYGISGPEASESLKRELLDTVEAGLIHDISVPILQAKAGFVHVGMSEGRIRQTVLHFTVILVVMAAFVLMIGAGLAALVSWAVTRPVRGLIEAAHEIRSGKLGRQVSTTAKDEIGDLVESFNQMSNELLRQHTVLDDQNRGIHLAQEQTVWERDKLRAIINCMVEGVLFVDTEGRISLCNKSAERIWAREAEQLLGRPLLECHPPAAHAYVKRILKLAKATPGFAQGHTMEARNGNSLNSYSSVHSQDGRYLGLVLLSLDISDRAALEREQKQLREQLFQQEKMVLIGQIAASVAHELNTPLSTVLLRAQLMQEQLKNRGDVSDLNVIESEALRCRGIIDSLLGFSRRSEASTSRADLCSLVRESLRLLKNDLANKGVSLKADYGERDAVIWANSNQIQQVLLNLITNAADAMPEGGNVEIRLGTSDESVEIRVIDDGLGMDQDVLRGAFEPFFTTKERGKGTGLGLPICQRIVEEHGGRIEIQSELHRGTTVMVRLPHGEPEAAANE